MILLWHALVAVFAGQVDFDVASRAEVFVGSVLSTFSRALFISNSFANHDRLGMSDTHRQSYIYNMAPHESAVNGLVKFTEAMLLNPNFTST